MRKYAFFSINPVSKPKTTKALYKQEFYDYSIIDNFIAVIGEENVLAVDHLRSGTTFPACVITYKDNELLTCPSCTREISNGFKFCPECATKLK